MLVSHAVTWSHGQTSRSRAVTVTVAVMKGHGHDDGHGHDHTVTRSRSHSYTVTRLHGHMVTRSRPRSHGHTVTHDGHGLGGAKCVTFCSVTARGGGDRLHGGGRIWYHVMWGGSSISPLPCMNHLGGRLALSSPPSSSGGGLALSSPPSSYGGGS